MKWNEIFKTERIKHNLKMCEVAKAINIEADRYRKYERGEREPEIDILIQLADLYNVSLDYLLARHVPNAHQNTTNSKNAL